MFLSSQRVSLSLCLVWLACGVLSTVTAQAGNDSATPVSAPMQVNPMSGKQSLEKTPELQQASLQPWWQSFEQPALNALVMQALLNNLDLKIAMAQTQQSQLIARASLAKELPRISLNPNITRQKNSKNLTTPNMRQFAMPGPQLFAPGQTVNIYSLPINIQYDLDPWLRNRLMTKALQQQTIAQALRVQALQRQVVASVVSTSVRWQRLHAEQQLLNKQDELLGLQKKLADDLIHAGLISQGQGIGYTQAILVNQQTLRGLHQQQQEAEKTLMLALGVTHPEQLSPWLQQLKTVSRQSYGIPNLIAKQSQQSAESLPAEVFQALEHRPDVAASQALLKAAGINVQVAKRLFLPSFSLTGQAGLTSTTLSNWLNWDSLLASVGAGMVQTLFAGGELKANLQQQKAFYNEHLYRYQQTYLTAVSEVATTQNQLQQAWQQYQLVKQQLHQQNDLLNQRYSQVRAGILPEREMLPTLVEHLNLHRQSVIAHEAVLQHWVSLQLAS
ncbi:MAG: TolC family protein [Vampirovibrionales bacterium]